MNTCPALCAGVYRSRALVTAAVKRHADRPLFGTRGEDGWHWTTYREFGSLVERFRAGLVSLGVKRGDKVAVISHNRLEWVVGAHAVYGLGAAYVPMYEAQLDKEWQYILADSGATVCLVANAAIEGRVRRIAEKVPALATRHHVRRRGPGHAMPICWPGAHRSRRPA